MKKLLSTLLAVLVLSSLSISAFAADTSSETVNPANAVIKQDNATIVSLHDQIKALRDSISTQTKSNKTSAADITGKLKSEKAALKASGADTSALKAQIAQLKTLKSQTDALKAQMLTAASDIKATQAKIDTDRTSAKADIKNKDFSSADQSLQDIISCEQKIITDMNSILSLKQQVASILSNFAATL